MLLHMETTRRTNGPAIAAIRQALGMTQTRLAAECGISGPYLSNVEAGRKFAGPAATAAIARQLGVSVDAITYPAIKQRAAA